MYCNKQKLGENKWIFEGGVSVVQVLLVFCIPQYWSNLNGNSMR
jgi:hypothetical protein